MEMIEEIAMWKADLASRLWRAEVVNRALGVPLHDAKELAREVELLLEIIGKLK